MNNLQIAEQREVLGNIEDVKVFAKTTIISKEKQEFITKRLKTIAQKMFKSEYGYTYNAFHGALKEFCGIDLYYRRYLSTTKKKGLVNFIYESEFEKVVERLFIGCPSLYSNSRMELLELGADIERLDKIFNNQGSN